MNGLEHGSMIKKECDKVCMKKGALTILEFLYICKKIIDILVALASTFEEKTAKLLVKIKEKNKK